VSIVEIIEKISAPIVAVIAYLALRAAKTQIAASSRDQQRATAYESYREYLKLCIEYPDFALAKRGEFYADLSKARQYKWFVSSMLISFEEILYVCPGETDWKSAIEAQIFLHRHHLKNSSSVRRGDWKPKLMEIINEQIIKP
jgi:hypothetical protein